MGVADSVYNHAPVGLQNMLLSLYGVYLGRLRYGADYREAYAEIVAHESCSREALEDYQSRQLQRLVRYAVERAPYYIDSYAHLKNKIDQISVANLKDFFPLLQKDVVRGGIESFYAKQQGLRYTRINTSGSTGSPLSVLTTRAAVSRNYAFFERFLNSHGVSYRDKSATFAGRMIIPPSQVEPPYWRHNAAQNTWLLSSYHLSDETCEAYIDFLSQLRPMFLDSYPSAIATLARYINKHRIVHEIRPKIIVTSSESLTDESRQEIMEAFSCKVADQYGNAEMAGFIAQCPHGQYHANSLYGFVEVVDSTGASLPPGNPGSLVLTGFVNSAMPLIRYVIGDSAMLSEERCECGSNFPVVKELLGRTDDLIILSDGRRIGRMDPLFKGLEGVAEAQIIQTALDHIEVNVVYAAGCTDRASVGLMLTQAIGTRLNANIRIDVREVPFIKKGANGKFKSVISLVER